MCYFGVPSERTNFKFLFTNEIRVIPIRNKEKRKIPALKDLMKEEEKNKGKTKNLNRKTNSLNVTEIFL